MKIKIDENKLQARAEKIQNEIHSFVGEIIKQKPEATHQDITNICLMRELAKLQLQIEQLPNSREGYII